MMQENIYSKNIMDVSIFPCSAVWASDGSVSLMAKGSVHVYIPNLQNMSMYGVRWLTIDRPPSAADADNGHQQSKMSLKQWLLETDQNSIQVDVSSIKYIPSVFQFHDAKILAVNFTCGSLILTCPGRNVNYTIHLPMSPGIVVNLNGLDYIMSLNDRFGTYRYEHQQFREINCFEFYSLQQSNDVLQNICVLITGSFDSADVWAIYRGSATNSDTSLEVKCLTSYPLNFLDDEDSFILPSCNHHFKCFSNAEPFCNDDESQHQKSFTQVIAAGSTSGIIFIFEIQVALPLSSVFEDIGEATAGVQLLCKMSISSQTIVSIKYCKGVYVAIAGESLFLFSVTKTTDALASNEWTIKVHSKLVVSSHPITAMSILPEPVPSGATSLFNVNFPGMDSTRQSERIPFMTTTFHGEMIMSYLLISTNDQGEKVYELALNNESTLIPTKGKCHLGLCVDPTSLVMAYVYKLDAAPETARETQLNRNLGKARSAITWTPLPFVSKHWALSDNAVCELFSLFAKNPEIGSSSIAALPVLYLQSLEAYIADNRVSMISPKNQFKPIERAVKEVSRKKKGSAGDDDSVDDMGEESDDDSEVKATPVKKVKNRETRTRASMRVIYNKIKDQLGPDIKSLTSSETERLVVGAAVISLKIHELVGVEISTPTFSLLDHELFDSAIVETVRSSSPAERIEVILHIPSEFPVLEVKMRVWMTLHLLILAAHNIRKVTITAENLQLLADLQNVLRVAYALKTVSSAIPIFGNVEGITVQGLQVISFATQILLDYGNKGTIGSTFVLSVAATAEELLNNLQATSGLSVPAELCCLCNSAVLFNASHPYASQCSQCEFTIDRCCITLQLIVHADAESSSAVTRGDENRFYRCPSCGSVANRAAVDNLVSHTSSLQLPLDLCPRDAFPWSRISCAICPFCSVLMARI